jgi:hypothetical protein
MTRRFLCVIAAAGERIVYVEQMEMLGVSMAASE